MVQCKGCNRGFTSSGYKLHIIRPINLVCRTIHLKEVNALCANDAEVAQDINTGPGLEDEDVAFEQLFDGIEDEFDGIVDGFSALDSESNSSNDSDGLDELLEELHLAEDDAGIAPHQPMVEGHEIKDFPGMEAGAPKVTPTARKSTYTKYQERLNRESVYAPFASKLDWEVARWAKLCGPSSSALDELLRIEGVSRLL